MRFLLDVTSSPGRRFTSSANERECKIIYTVGLSNIFSSPSDLQSLQKSGKYLLASFCGIFLDRTSKMVSCFKNQFCLKTSFAKQSNLVKTSFFVGYSQLIETKIHMQQFVHFRFSSRKAPSWGPPTRLGTRNCTIALEWGVIKALQCKMNSSNMETKHIAHRPRQLFGARWFGHH